MREKFIYKQCIKEIIDKQSPGRNRIRIVLETIGQRFSRQAYLWAMTDDWAGRKRILYIAFIKPYVWAKDSALPRNNLIYLIATQFRWLRLVISGRMTKEGKVKKK